MAGLGAYCQSLLSKLQEEKRHDDDAPRWLLPLILDWQGASPGFLEAYEDD